MDAVSRIGEGLISCHDVIELQQFPGLRTVCLHGNLITRIEGLQRLARLTNLNLSSNSIMAIENLQVTSLCNNALQSTLK